MLRPATTYLLAMLLMSSAAAFAAEPTPAPLPPEQAVAGMRVPQGFNVTLVAAEPDVVQPISYCFDDRGRLFVAEALNYGEWQPTGKDRIVILEDTDADGRFESRKVFFEGLNYVTGIEVGFGGVWVISPPKLYFIPDRDADDQPDGEPQILFDGFGYEESRHNLANGFTWGPDGWLYAGHGRTSPSDVGRPGAEKADRIHCDGGVYRIHPTRMVFENFADGTTNPWGVDFNDYGQCFVSNCVNPHLFHIIQGGHYEPWRNRPSSQFAYDRIATCADHLHYPSGLPNAMRGETAETLALGGGHAHCGTLIYLGDNFPPSYRNTAFMCNIHGRRINHDILRPQGSGYVASHDRDLMVAEDPWFMGVTLRTGPNGSIFVSDWSDTGECHTYRPHRDNGRVYSISYGEPKRTAVDLSKQSDEELVQLQLHRNDWYVQHARRLLQERAVLPGWKGEAVHAALQEILASHPDVTRRLRALWALHVTGGLDAEKLSALLDDRSEHLRAWAIQLLCENREPPPDALLKFAKMAGSDPSPVVRLYLAAALQRLPLKKRGEMAEGLIAHAEDAADQNLPLMYWYGIEPLVPESGDRALKLAATAKLPLLREFLARRLVDDAIAQGEMGTLDVLASALSEAGEPDRHDLLQGAREGLRGRKSMKMPADWPAVYAKLKASANTAVRENATLLALVFDDPLALADMREIVQSATAQPKKRQAALEALIDKRQPDLAPLLHDMLADKALRRAALGGLASIPHEATPGKILARYAELTPQEKQAAVATLASRKEFALVLLDAVERKEIAAADISAYVARQLYALGDNVVTEQLRKVWGEVRDTLPQRREQLARYKSLLTPGYLQQADLSSGRQLYVKTCQQCHMLLGEGGKIGPDLTGANRANLDYLLSNILDPSAEIGRDYRMSVISTTDGRVITGVILERMPGRITLQTATERVVLASEEVELVKDSTASMMPDGQFENLTKEQVRDLIAYLAAPPASEKITVQNPQQLPASPIPCERIALGEPDDYKPCIARLPDGELLLTAFHQHQRDGGKVMEQTLLFRSRDGGQTWFPPEKLDVLGREPYLTVLPDGTIFITGHLLANDERNRWGYTCGFVHRSTDRGRTWESIRIESEGIKPGASNHSTRNVLQLSDGTLLLGVDYDGGGGPYLMWRSTDGGRTWDKSQKCEPKDFKSQYGFFGGETWLWQSRSGKLWALVRVDSNELPIKDRSIKADDDQSDHFVLFSSADGGKTFDRIRDFGDYGEMYMSLLRLQDKRLLLTFTVRDLRPPLGVRALLGKQTDDGFDFDFQHDRIVLDALTPVGKDQGGGFGPTVELADETLVTSYSYRGPDNKTHLEVVRWKPPAK